MKPTKEEAINDNKRMILNIANKYRARAIKKHIEFEDLVSMGYIITLKALERYKDTKGTKFSSFLYTALDLEMRVMINAHNVGLYVPRYVKDIANRLILINEYEGMAVSDLAEMVNASEFEITSALDYLNMPSMKSMDYQAGKNDDAEFSELIGADADVSMLNVMEFMDTLDENERVIVKGLFNGLKQKQIAEQIGYTSQYVSKKLVSEIRPKLQEYMNEGVC